jgi:hypothetical protein
VIRPDSPRCAWAICAAERHLTELWPQLGDNGGYLEERPKAVVILGEVHPVYSWRDVLRRTSEVAVQWCNDNFEETVIANRTSCFTRTPTSDAWYELPNGWWVLVNLNADTIKQLCASIVESAETPEEEYKILLW